MVNRVEFVWKTNWRADDFVAAARIGLKKGLSSMGSKLSAEEILGAKPLGEGQNMSKPWFQKS